MFHVFARAPIDDNEAAPHTCIDLDPYHFAAGGGKEPSADSERIEPRVKDALGRKLEVPDHTHSRTSFIGHGVFP
jgi:hypothetical protein